MPMELRWYDGSPPYSVWFRRSPSDSANTVPGLGAWSYITATNYLVPCTAPAGSRIELVLQDSTGWISISRGSFVVLPSSNSSCLRETFNASGLSQSQSILSTLLRNFQQNVISAISVSATASASPAVTVIRTAASVSFSSASPTATSITVSTSSSTGSISILGPVLGTLLAVLLCIAIGIYIIRRRRRKEPDLHIPPNSTSSFDLLDGERPGSARRPETATQEMRPTGAVPSMIHPINTATNVNPIADAPRSRLRLHNGTTTDWPSTVKNRQSAVSPLPAASEQVPPTRTIQQQDQQNLEERAEQLSGPELERLAALVARRLERVRGAPPQYQATEGIGV